MGKINWGILGAANIAYEELVPAIRRSNNGELVAVASRNKERAKRFNVSTIYESYDELLNDEKIDAVYIPLPNSLHKEWVIKAMEHKKHVLVEKPATLTRADMKEIKDSSVANDVVFMEAFMYQFHSQHTFVKEVLASNEIGNYQYIKSHFSFLLDNEQDIRLNKELGGGAFWDLGCYGTHAVTQIIGMKPNKVTMMGKVPEEHGVDTTSVALFLDENNRTAEVSASFEGSFTNRYEVFGEKGTLKVEYAFRPDESEKGEGVVKVLNQEGHVIHEKVFEDDSYLLQIEHFQSCIKENKQPIYNANHSLKVITCIESAYNSLENASKLVTFNL